MSDQQLKQHRDAIDAIDVQILELINRRADHARQIGEIKGGGVMYRPEREAQVLRRIKDLNQGPLPDEGVARLFREIMSACLSLERPLNVAFLGPLGTFTESAAVKHFGHAALLAPCRSIDEVFRATESGQTDFAVVPVENSTEGAVGRTLDLLIQTSLKVCGEVVLRIHQHLLRKSATLAGIQRVYSHSQSLGQCHEWLNAHLPNVERIPVTSNAEAARLAAQDDSSAAIAGEAAAERYELIKVVANIEDEPNNTTRFLVLGQQDAPPSGKDKTSLLLTAKNQPGAVHELLAPLAATGVSMSKFESRPAKGGTWEYVFFVDVEGHRDVEPVRTAMEQLRERAVMLRVLGSYPVAVL